MKTLSVYDFRIGNYLQTPYSDFSIIDEVGLKDGNGYVKLKDKPMGYYLDLCKSIPLTEELLLKCGFKRVGDTLLYLPCPNINSEIHYEIHSYGNVITLQCDFGEFLPNDIEYLHQLQNLYCILTDKELEIKI